MKKRFVRLVAFMFVDKFNGVITDGIRVIKFCGFVIGISICGDGSIIACQGVGVIETSATLKGAIKSVKATLHGPIMP